MNRSIEYLSSTELSGFSRVLRLTDNCIITTEASDTYLEKDSDYRKTQVTLDIESTGAKIDLADYFTKLYATKIGKLHFGRTFLNNFAAECRKGVISLPKEGLGEDPRSILAVFHELGHIIAYKEDLEKNPNKAKASVGALGKEGVKAKKFMYEIEEDAWKKGVLAAGQFKDDLSVNVFSLFSDSDDFFNYINGPLSRHKDQIVKAGSKIEYKTLKDQRFEDFIRSVFEKNKVKAK